MVQNVYVAYWLCYVKFVCGLMAISHRPLSSATATTVLIVTAVFGPRHFGPKTVRHYIFGTELSYFFCVGAEVSLGHFGTSAEVSQHFMKGPKCEVSNGHFSTSAVVSRTDRRRFDVLVSLHHLMPHLHYPSRSSDSVSRHSVYTKSYPDIHI